MPSVTAEILDPRTGEKRRISLVDLGGRLHLQDVTNTDRSLASPARLEADAHFALAATTAYGKRMTGRLPPAAEAVQATRFVRAGGGTLFSRRRVRRQEELRNLLGEATLARMVEQLRREGALDRALRPSRIRGKTEATFESDPGDLGESPG